MISACLVPLKNDLAKTYEAQASLHSALNHALGSSKGNWLIPALHVVCRNTHRAAALADECVNRSTGNRNDHARLQNAVTLLQASYSKTLNDRVEMRVRFSVFSCSSQFGLQLKLKHANIAAQ